MADKIPSYPVVHATVRSDGSAHVNVAGRHIDYPAADLDTTRDAVIAYTSGIASRLGRAVRMSTADADGLWTLGVYPDGEVVDLAPPAKEPRRQRAAALVDDVHRARGIRDAARQRRVHRERAGELVDGEAVLDGERDAHDEL
ncbi:hypothetical protein BH09ACT5_BH09ACT5_24320 [soil metagenome]